MAILHCNEVCPITAYGLREVEEERADGRVTRRRARVLVYGKGREKVEVTAVEYPGNGEYLNKNSVPGGCRVTCNLASQIEVFLHASSGVRGTTDLDCSYLRERFSVVLARE